MQTYTYRNLQTSEQAVFTTETYIQSLDLAVKLWFKGIAFCNFTATKSGRIIIIQGNGNNHLLLEKT
jgi:hypothetical protein